MRVVKFLTAMFIVLFLLPAMATAAWWTVQDRPHSWRSADWSSSGVLPPASSVKGPAIYVLAARLGGLKGAFSVHSWIVIKHSDAASYDRYDKVGWGIPVRKNGWAADGRWYSNPPEIIAAVTGDEATGVIDRIEAAIANYPYSHRGDYQSWPGPNSNSFVAHVLRKVPELGTELPPNAIGRDFAPGPAAVRIDNDWKELHVTLGGLAGFAIGIRSGLEVHLLGLVAGVDFDEPALKIPAVGLVKLPFT